jgi:hypothetical protein
VQHAVQVIRRRVYASPGVQDMQLLPALVALATFERAGGDDDTPVLLLVTHLFATPDGVLRLTTLVCQDKVRTHPDVDAALRKAVFGADAHVALARETTGGTCAWTDVALGSAGSLSTDALASLSHAQRAMLRAAQSAQFLFTVAACIEARFAGNVMLLQAAAKRGRPALATALDALCLKVVATRRAWRGGPYDPLNLCLREAWRGAGDSGRLPWRCSRVQDVHRRPAP